MVEAREVAKKRLKEILPKDRRGCKWHNKETVERYQKAKKRKRERTDRDKFYGIG